MLPLEPGAILGALILSFNNLIAEQQYIVDFDLKLRP